MTATITTQADYITETYGTDLDRVVEIHCGKCGGSGIIEVFFHVHDGVCFDCDGRGIVERVTVKVLLRRAKARDRREAKRQAAQAEREALAAQKALAAQSWRESNVELVREAEALGVTWHQEWDIEPTERMLTVWQERISEAKARKASQEAAGSLTAGRRVITGKIISTKEQLDTYSYQERYIAKMLVETTDGHRVFGTLPDSLITELAAVDGDWLSAAKGREVTFTATVEPSRDDEHFGFYKRPTKAQLI